MYRLKQLLCLVLVLKAGYCQFDMTSMMAMSNGMGAMGGGANDMMLAGMTGMAGDMSPMDMMLLTQAVKTIIGQHASPDLALINFAQMQGGQPTSMTTIMPYMAFFENLAGQVGLQMPDGTKKFPGRGGANGLTRQRMRSLITQRAMRWFTNNRMMTGMSGAVF